MNDAFEKRVRAAAVAGWWTLLIAVGFISLLWIIYLVVMPARPARLLAMWGPDVDWAFVWKAKAEDVLAKVRRAREVLDKTPSA